jgi:hypothetical protein
VLVDIHRSGAAETSRPTTHRANPCGGRHRTTASPTCRARCRIRRPPPSTTPRFHTP